MSEPPIHNVTMLLHAAGEGDSAAAEQLLPLIYQELRKLASARMNKERGEGAGLTLQPTALVHEAYLRLVTPEGGQELKWNGRGHFFAAAALAMRRILIERARHAKRVKHGGQMKRQDLGEGGTMSELQAPAPNEASDATDLLALDDALNKLSEYDSRKAQIVMLRYFAGLSIEETAAALDLSPSTVKNEWTFARTWLAREMAGQAASQSDAPKGRKEDQA